MKKKLHEIFKELGTEVDLDAIKSLRTLRKINQKIVADELGMELQAYQRRENGKVDFTAMELKMIAFILGEPVEFFYTDYEPDFDTATSLAKIAEKLQASGVHASTAKRVKS